MKEVRTLVDSIEKQLGQKTIISIYLRHSEIGSIFQSTQDFNEALKLSKEVIGDTIEYYEGNDINEALVDPYIIVTSVLMQLGNIQQAAEYLNKAEGVVQALQGEMSDKIIEILTQKISIQMATQQYDLGL